MTAYSSKAIERLERRVAELEAVREAAARVVANQILVRYDNQADPMFDLADALKLAGDGGGA